MANVLVTGGSGFIGSYCILRLLADGHTVRTTVRDLRREAEVRAVLRQGGAAADAPVSFVAADLTADAGWAEAVAGCEYVHHVASPFPPTVPKNEDELIVPAREGTLRVLRAARAATVQRVIVTSSFAAVGYGHPIRRTPFDERDWTNLSDGTVPPYQKSKTIAERAAWDFMAQPGRAMELATVNPVGVFGPVLGRDYSSSILIVQKLMEGALPGVPKISFGAVDVRDVADLHVRAMTHPEAKNERFLAVAGDFISFMDLANVLIRRMGAAAKKVPRRQLPNWLLRVAALFDPQVRSILPELGHIKNATSDKARRLLGWKPLSSEESIVATAESLIKLGVL